RPSAHALAERIPHINEEGLTAWPRLRGAIGLGVQVDRGIRPAEVFDRSDFLRYYDPALVRRGPGRGTGNLRDGRIRAGVGPEGRGQPPTRCQLYITVQEPGTSELDPRWPKLVRRQWVAAGSPGGPLELIEDMIRNKYKWLGRFEASDVTEIVGQVDKEI